ncbi:hypothetical protein SPRG_13927 [Saprolegnia parasitica CBS 223.65]|uniref:Calcineurin-like phosphoesterase domain-containing protein n=1 Tax=Saprolegnia parasitica (strain CBS 223.65) TaxID=695850 RepID=A0A067C2F8_SAPPC|nr:hypothetical protein SPRG_13927 [Saprolegnia parasitica CBS 223.65]KDO20716.1 hypothetical protein SPRG_13927 [Saprolegnia parasitica CBS 223.65]|eukprot:XP_012208597.1 hypothetical protein SPRG_13927 [Saprolegnia parasitica CBS 223.65]
MRRGLTLAAIRHRVFLWRRALGCERAFVVIFLGALALLALTSSVTAPSRFARSIYRADELPALQATVVNDVGQAPTLRFRILQLTDMHYTGRQHYPCRNPPHKAVERHLPCTESRMTEFIRHLLDTVEPDFVVFSGDLIESVEVPHTAAEVVDALHAATSEVVRRNLPWSMVFGNHDEGTTMSRRVMFGHLEDLPFGYIAMGPEGIGGVGNYALRVQAPQDGPWNARKSIPSLLRLYFIDSVKGLFTPSQLEFVTELSAATYHEHVPALMFFHHPLHEFKQYVDGDGQGQRLEKVSHGDHNSGMFDALAQMGDVKGVFVGHDHFNDYCFYNAPLHLCYGGGVGYGAAYGFEYTPRRARVIEWTWKTDAERITTWLHEDLSMGGTVSDKYKVFERKHARQKLRAHDDMFLV